MRKEQLWIDKFNNQEKVLLENYFNDLNSSILLSKRDTKRFINDFEKAIDYYYNKNYKIPAILSILSLKNIGSFYIDNSEVWYPLDNAAKIYPLSIKRNWMSVFRISVYLKGYVIPEILQIALTFTIKRFPSFATTVRKGFFWHYLEGIRRRFSLHPEANVPCSSINISSINKKTFRTLYYKNRISVEFFHVLTDGYGATIFLKALVSEYLHLLGKIEKPLIDINELPKKEEISNDFIKCDKTVSSSFKDTKALQIDGKLSSVLPSRVLHFELDEKEIKEYCKQKNITVTVLILAFIFKSISYVTSKNEYIKVQVPVNMRKFYNSLTLRNFSLYAVISIKRNDINEMDELIKEINNQLKEKTSKKELDKTCSYTNRLVSSISLIPLILKTPIAKMVYGFLGEKVLSTTLSNLGNISFDEKTSKYIEKMDFVLGTSLTNKALFSLISCNGIMNFTVTKSTTNSSLEHMLYKELTDAGFKVIVSGSETYESK